MVSFHVAGEALVDIVDSVAHPGGSPLNVAVGLGRLGRDVTLSTDIGADKYGELIEDHLRDSGVQLAAAASVAEPTSTATVTLDAASNASYEFELHCALEQLEPSDAELLHTGSIAAFRSPSAQKLIEVFSTAAQDQLKSYDPNLRPALVDDRNAAISHIEKLCSLAHVVKLSDEDALWLYPGWDTDRVLERILDLGASLAVMTFGAHGAQAMTREHEIVVPAFSVTTVDTVGAGDAFMAGLLHALFEGSLAQDLLDGKTLDRTELERALEIAAACAGMTVARTGANPPTLSELNEFLLSVGS